MPFVRPPSQGFIGLLTGQESFELHVEQISVHALARLGLFPLFDKARLATTLQLWRETYARWKEPSEPADKVSHIKMAGALLWSFIQEEALPIDQIVQIAPEHLNKLEQFGANDRVLDFQKGKGDIFQGAPNPAIGFVVVTSIFNTIQRARKMTRSGIDFDKPPLTKHYLHNMACWYMIDHDPRPEDLYMIFKTMDLYALNHPTID